MIPYYGTHDSRKRINSKSVQEENKIWVLVAEAYGYVVQFKSYQSAKKQKQVASSTKWGLGKYVALRLMECVTSAFSFNIFMDNISHFFVYLPTLELTKLEQQVYSTKKGLANALSLGTNNWQIQCGYFEQRTSSKQSCATLTVAG